MSATSMRLGLGDPEVRSSPGRVFALACDVCGARTPVRKSYAELLAAAADAGWRALPAASDRAVDGRYACGGCVPRFRWLP